MTDSMAQPLSGSRPFELPVWKSVAGTGSAVLLALIFLVSGLWKVTDPISAAARMVQAMAPPALSLPLALGVGICETFSAVLILVPRFRRWGAWLIGFQLVAFMVYIGYYYDALRGEECNCFPWVKRLVGPAFFWSDGAMLALAGAAGWWARPSEGKRGAALVLAAVAVFALASFGIQAARQAGIMAPETILVDGKPYPLGQGRVFLFFFNPECTHCDAAARSLARLNWGETKVVAVVTEQAQFGPEFLSATGLPALLTADVATLRERFSFVDAPYAVALENGRQKAAFAAFDENEPAATLHRLGFVGE